MAQLVLLVVAAAWAAVLIPPMLRSRVENRPNSSVTDFRRQLNKLQSTATPSRGAPRPIGRPLAPSPLQRPAAGGRPAPRVRSHHRVSHVAPSPPTVRARAAHRAEPTRGARTDGAQGALRYRTHGEPGHVHHDADHPAHRTTHMRPAASSGAPRKVVQRRRSNVLFVLLLTAACALFLAVTTSSPGMTYAFVLAFLALCGYVLLLAQIRQREAIRERDSVRSTAR